MSVVISSLAVPAFAQTPHSDEIQAYATIAAMAQTASDRCADVLVNNAMLAKAPAFFHLGPDDQQAYQLAVGIEMKRFAASIASAPSLKAWCEVAYRAYGPDGDIVRGLLGR